MSKQFSPAIAANIEALTELLWTAAERSREANDAMKSGQRNQAIGGLCGLEDILAAAQSLHGAALTLHRQG